MSVMGWVIDANGEIVRGTSSPTAEELLLDVGEGQGLVLDPPPDNTARWTGEAWVSRPAKPSPASQWDGAAAQWIDPRTLDARKADAWARIKASREAAEFGGFDFDGYPYDSDPQAQSRIQGGAQLATLAMLNGQPFEIDWTLADNQVRHLDVTGMLGAGQAMGVHIVTVHAIGRALREAIEAATTAAELDAILWPNQ